LGGHASGSPAVVDRKLLGIYLNDHLARSVVGSSLAKRIVCQNEVRVGIGSGKRSLQASGAPSP
jgi:hypothetical protein